MRVHGSGLGVEGFGFFGLRVELLGLRVLGETSGTSSAPTKLEGSSLVWGCGVGVSGVRVWDLRV